MSLSRRITYFSPLTSTSVPEYFKLPTGRGSTAGGVALIVIGVLFLLDLNTDISMEWIEDWWPLALVAFGVYLVRKARRGND